MRLCAHIATSLKPDPLTEPASFTRPIMPHAVDEDLLREQQDDAEIARLLEGGEQDDRLAFLNRDLEVGEKADDAEDFEDIGDDDLISEEDEDAPALNGNGHTSHSDLPPVDDAVYEDDFGDDLFGDDAPSSPVEGVGEANGLAPSAPSRGLALPSKSTIALPGHMGHKTNLGRSMFESPTSYEAPHAARSFVHEPTSSVTPEPEVESEDEDEDVRRQRELFSAAKERLRRGSSYEPPAKAEADMDEFYSIWPTYDPDRIPRFTELFPPRSGTYNWKAPLKPPKPVQPTKLSLELQQDAERNFRTVTVPTAGKVARDVDTDRTGVIYVTSSRQEDQQSADDMDLDEVDEDEEIGGVTWRDITFLCEDWDMMSASSLDSGTPKPSQQFDSGVDMGNDWYKDSSAPPAKRRKLSHFDFEGASAVTHDFPSLEEPEHTTARIARRVALDLNDPNLLIDENAPNLQTKKLRRAVAGSTRQARGAIARDMSRRYNISNDEAYELLKENHQHKVRSTLGSMTVDHSLPAVKLQYPFYKVKLDPKQLRSFHRPQFSGPRAGREYRFTKPRVVKKKHLKGKETHEIFEKAEDLSMGDNSSALLLEYSEEMPTMLSNFGMGNRVVNYYRRKDDQDSSRPKEEIGETHVLLPQDRSPFSNFGQVDPGELVPSIHNGLYRAPIFKHEGRNTDFLIVNSTSTENGTKFYMRNIENLHVVGQQFPSTEVPGEHSRKVTEAAKRRLRTLSYRVYKKSIERKGPPLTNQIVQQHLIGSDIAQNRSKMREFMAYRKAEQIWVPKDDMPIPDPETLRTWIKPEDICLIDSMQVGVQHLTDLGLRTEGSKDDEKDVEEGANIELQLAPWATTKNFINACQGKAMLQLHGEGEPTGRGEGFSFIKTSMKGGFRALGESIEERLDAKRLKENNGHSYNVARQQKAYDESIRRIWRAQHDSLTSNMDHSDSEDDIDDEPETAVDRRATPHSAFGTPAAFMRPGDESASQFSRNSTGQNNQTMVITRTVMNNYGQMEEVPVTVTNPRVISAYKKAKTKQKEAQLK